MSSPVGRKKHKDAKTGAAAAADASTTLTATKATMTTTTLNNNRTPRRQQQRILTVGLTDLITAAAHVYAAQLFMEHANPSPHFRVQLSVLRINAVVAALLMIAVAGLLGAARFLLAPKLFSGLHREWVDLASMVGLPLLGQRVFMALREYYDIDFNTFFVNYLRPSMMPGAVHALLGDVDKFFLQQPMSYLLLLLALGTTLLGVFGKKHKTKIAALLNLVFVFAPFLAFGYVFDDKCLLYCTCIYFFAMGVVGFDADRRIPFLLGLRRADVTHLLMAIAIPGIAHSLATINTKNIRVENV